MNPGRERMEAALRDVRRVALETDPLKQVDSAWLRGYVLGRTEKLVKEIREREDES